MAILFTSNKYMEPDFPFYVDRMIHTYNGKLIPHRHDFVELVYVVKGEAMHWFEGRFYKIGPDDVFIINPGEAHMYHVQNEGRMEIINCLFKPSLLTESLLRELQLMKEMDFLYVLPFLDQCERFEHRQPLEKNKATIILQLLEQMITEYRQKHAGYQTLIRMKMVEILVMLSRYCRYQVDLVGNQWLDDDIRLRRICGYLERHSYEKLNVESVAKILHLSVRQLNRLLKAKTGHSVIGLVHKFRLQQARQLLEETEEKVVAIAGLVGYDSPQFFNRLFMRETGCSPTEYRAQYQAKQAQEQNDRSGDQEATKAGGLIE